MAELERERGTESKASARRPDLDVERRAEEEAPPPPAEAESPGDLAATEDDPVPTAAEAIPDDPLVEPIEISVQGPLPPRGAPRRASSRVGGWIERRVEKIVGRLFEAKGREIERRAMSMVQRIYEQRAADVQERARRVVTEAYDAKADDLQNRAVRAMRRAVRLESKRIRLLVEAGVAAKKREVRLSLLVLVVASLVYLVLAVMA